MTTARTTSSVRVRFAPSPTGHLHIGGLRTALFNLLYARTVGGAFLLRIEDTDIARSKKEYTDAILEALEWADITPDEPVVIQTAQVERHKRMIEKLLLEGKAYRCYCAANAMATEDDYFKYDGKCRTRTQEKNGMSFVVRIKLPLEQKVIAFHDLIRGDLSFAIQEFDDFIIARSDGTPVYNFVVVVDDAMMKITHVIRGEDHISNTPKQIVLYQALGFTVPQFGHLPMILGASGQRLSKRDAATAVTDYKKAGYLPEALCNYLVRLGWAHGDQEIFTRQELIEIFSLADVGKKASIFDQQKLNWFNGIYMRERSPQELLQFMERDVNPQFRAQVSTWSQEQIEAFIMLYRERVDTLAMLSQELVALHDGTLKPSAEDLQKYIEPSTSTYLQNVRDTLGNLSPFTTQTISEALKALIKQLNIQLPKIAQPIRLALVGKTTSPGVFELIALLGKNVCLERLEQFLLRLQK